MKQLSRFLKAHEGHRLDYGCDDRLEYEEFESLSEREWECRCKCKMQPEELRVEVYTQGKDSAVRITHVPTGAVSEATGEASQHQNRAKALKQLAEKIQAHHVQEADR